MIFSLIFFFRIFQSLRSFCSRRRKTRFARRGLFLVVRLVAYFPNSPPNRGRLGRRSPQSRSTTLKAQTASAPRSVATALGRLETPTNRRENFSASILFIFHFFSFFASRGRRKPPLFRSKDENFKKTFFPPFKIDKLQKIYRRQRPRVGWSSSAVDRFDRRQTLFCVVDRSVLSARSRLFAAARNATSKKTPRSDERNAALNARSATLRRLRQLSSGSLIVVPTSK